MHTTRYALAPSLLLSLACSGADTSVASGSSSTAGAATTTGDPLASSSGPGASTSTGSSGAIPTSEGGPGGEGPKLDVGGAATADSTGATDTETGGEIVPIPEFPTTCAEAAMGSTSVGCEFYPLALAQDIYPMAGTSFTVANVSHDPASVTLSDAVGVVASEVVAPGAVHTFTVGLEHALTPYTGVTLDGYVIESDEVLQVFESLPPNVQPTADAGLVFPRQALGVRHRVAAYNGQNNDGFAEYGSQYVAIVARQDGTDVTFTLPRAGMESLGGTDIPALDVDAGEATFTTTIDRLEVLVVAAHNFDMGNGDYDNDITGSLVESNHPVAVYSGTIPTYIPAGPGLCCADLIADAVPPTAVYGQHYAGVKFLPLGEEYDVWRFVGDEDDTNIELSGDADQVIVVDAGEYVDVTTDQSFWADGDKPFGLIHFMTSATVAGPLTSVDAYDCGELWNPGDPALTWAFPAGNWLNRYTFPVGTSNGGEGCNDHVNVVALLEHWDEITLDGAALPAGTELGDSGYGYARVPVPGPVYDLLAPEGVGVELTVYGYITHGSYVYPGGVGFQALNPDPPRG